MASPPRKAETQPLIASTASTLAPATTPSALFSVVSTASAQNASSPASLTERLFAKIGLKTSSQRQNALVVAALISSIVIITGLSVLYFKKPDECPHHLPQIPDDTCIQMFTRQSSYLSSNLTDLYQTFSDKITLLTSSFCPSQVTNSSVIQQAAFERSSLSHQVGEAAVSEIFSGTDYPKWIVETGRNLTNSCLNGDGKSLEDNVIAWSVLYPLGISLKTWTTGAFSCLEGVCRRITSQVHFANSGQTYTCSRLTNMYTSIKALGSILKFS